MSLSEGRFDGAVKNFQAVIAAHDMLKEAGYTSSLDEKQNYTDQVYVTALAALNANQNDVGKSLFMKLYEEGTDKAAVYESLYKLNSEADLAGAYKYLEEGRIKFQKFLLDVQ